MITYVRKETITPIALALQRACAPCLAGDLEEAVVQIDQVAEQVTRETQIPLADQQLWYSFAKHLVYSWMLPNNWELLVKLLGIYPWDDATISYLLHSLHFLPENDPAMIAAQHGRWGLRWSDVPVPDWTHVDRDPQRCLHIGYLSPDFRHHCVAHFFEPLLDAHDRQAFQIWGYGHVPPDQRDETTQRLIGKFDAYRDIWGASDDQVVAQIRADQIDILVDLAGHTRHHRLGVFAQRPAPIQVTYLGYPNTTGLAAMDGRITDKVLNPPESQSSDTERLITLDRCFACYHLNEEVTPRGTPRERVVFGSFVGSAKHNPQVLDLWARILAQVPEATLRLRFWGAEHGLIQQQCRQAFVRRGVSAERLSFDGIRPFVEHLACYHEIDIALDTMPWSSHTSVCEALWMGVPVISLLGHSTVSRMGASVLYALELDDLVASTAQEYVERASALAGNSERLQGLRKTLRARVQQSPMGNGPQHAQAVEEVFRRLWSDVG